VGKGANKCGSSISLQVDLPGTNGAVNPVTPGVVDEAARKAYLNGQCAALAIALQERLGGSIVAIGYDDENDDYEAWHQSPVYSHVGLALKNGSVIDIEGAHELEEWMEHHNCWEETVLTEQQALSLSQFPSQEISTARLTANALLSSLQY